MQGTLFGTKTFALFRSDLDEWFQAGFVDSLNKIGANAARTSALVSEQGGHIAIIPH